MHPTPRDYANMITFRTSSATEEISVSGTVFHERNQRIVSVNNYRVEFKPQGHILYILNRDVPGVVGRVGTTLGDHEVNIAEYNLARSESGGTAMAVITTDSPLSDDALTALRMMPAIKEVKQIGYSAASTFVFDPRSRAGADGYRWRATDTTRVTIDAMRTPPILWHYTDAAGLYGIVQSGQLRFGDARLLNDRTEQTYADKVLRDVVAEEDRPDKHRVIAMAVQSIDSTRFPIRLYVCSFSETKESISQWQRYGADGAGYCVGFDTAVLDELFSKWLWRKKMRYKVRDQRDVFRRKLRSASAEQDGWPTIDVSWLEDKVLMSSAKLGAKLDDAMLQIKNPFFSDEREWRHILSKDARVQDDTPSTPEDFAPRGTYVKPFIALPSNPTALPIKSVVCGPRLNYEIAEPATSRFLRARRYLRTKVERSELTDIWR